MMGRHLVGMDEDTIGFPTENDPPPPPSRPTFRLGRCAEDRLIILDGKVSTLIDVFRGAEAKSNTSGQAGCSIHDERIGADQERKCTFPFIISSFAHMGEYLKYGTFPAVVC
jgi:hypothetical protein